MNCIITTFRLRKASYILEEAIEILSYEPENTVEGSRWKTACEFRIYLGHLVNSLQSQDHCEELEKKKVSD